MRFLLNTDAAVRILVQGAAESAVLLARYQQLAADDLALSAMTVAELKLGVMQLAAADLHDDGKKEMADRANLLLSSLTVLPVDERAAEAAAVFRHFCMKSRRPLAGTDAFIAGQAISLNLTLLVDDCTPWQSIAFPDLKWMDWKSPSGF